MSASEAETAQLSVELEESADAGGVKIATAQSAPIVRINSTAEDEPTRTLTSKSAAQRLLTRTGRFAAERATKAHRIENAIENGMAVEHSVKKTELLVELNEDLLNDVTAQDPCVRAVMNFWTGSHDLVKVVTAGNQVTQATQGSAMKGAGEKSGHDSDDEESSEDYHYGYYKIGVTTTEGGENDWNCCKSMSSFELHHFVKRLVDDFFTRMGFEDDEELDSDASCMDAHEHGLGLITREAEREKLVNRLLGLTDSKKETMVFGDTLILTTPSVLVTNYPRILMVELDEEVNFGVGDVGQTSSNTKRVCCIFYPTNFDIEYQEIYRGIKKDDDWVPSCGCLKAWARLLGEGSNTLANARGQASDEQFDTWIKSDQRKYSLKPEHTKAHVWIASLMLSFIRNPCVIRQQGKELTKLAAFYADGRKKTELYGSKLLGHADADSNDAEPGQVPVIDPVKGSMESVRDHDYVIRAARPKNSKKKESMEALLEQRDSWMRRAMRKFLRNYCNEKNTAFTKHTTFSNGAEMNEKGHTNKHGGHKTPQVVLDNYLMLSVGINQAALQSGIEEKLKEGEEKPGKYSQEEIWALEQELTVAKDRKGIFGRLNICAGLISDVKHRFCNCSMYKSDWTDIYIPEKKVGDEVISSAQNNIGTVIMSILMMYIATLAPTIAFGALLDADTSHNIGITETMLCQGAVGMVAAILGGQHLSILRPTGPVVAFMGVAMQNAVNGPGAEYFMEFWAWTSLWCGMFLMIFAMTDLAHFIKFVTNFTEDVFSALISTLFLYAAINHINIYFDADMAHVTVASLSLFFLILTVYICMQLQNFKTSSLMSPAVRSFITNFHMLFAMICVIILANVLKGGGVEEPDKWGFWSVGCYDCTNCTTNNICFGGGSAEIDHCCVYDSSNDTRRSFEDALAETQDYSDGYLRRGTSDTRRRSTASCAAYREITYYDSSDSRRRSRRNGENDWSYDSDDSEFSLRRGGSAGVVEVVTNTSCNIGEIPLLSVPATAFTPTDQDRSWFVDMTRMPGSPGFQTFSLGLLLALLFFVEQNITSVMLAAKDKKLVKPPAFHWDMFLVGVCVIICGQLGLPVAHASLPHSIYHIEALAMKKTELVHINGEAKYQTKILGVCETRISAFMVNLMILLTIGLLPSAEGMLPEAMIYGLFFWMGVSGLMVNPLCKRIGYLFYERALLPPGDMFRKVETHYIIKYLFMQVLCLGAIWAVKKTQGAYFPIVIMLMIPMRMFILPYFFNQKTPVKDPTTGKTVYWTFEEWTGKKWVPPGQHGDGYYEYTRGGKFFNDDELTAWIKSMYAPEQQKNLCNRFGSITEHLESMETTHDQDSFKSQAKEIYHIFQLMKSRNDAWIRDHAEEAGVAPGAAAEDSALLQELMDAFIAFADHPPLDRLAFLDPHEGGDHDHHAKKH